MTEICDRDRLRDVRNGLFLAFNWATTKQGSKYWQDVYDNLNEIQAEEKSPVLTTRTKVAEQLRKLANELEGKSNV